MTLVERRKQGGEKVAYIKIIDKWEFLIVFFISIKSVLYYSSVFLLFFITTNITFGNVSNFSERVALLEEAFGSLNSKDDNDMLDLHERLSTMKNITNTKIIKNGTVKYGETYFLTENVTPFDIKEN